MPYHTFNPVPFILIDEQRKNCTLRSGNVGMQDIAPTILDILEIEKPVEMTGTSLIV